MELEMKAQLHMLQQSDFKNWAAHVNKHGGDEKKAPPWIRWMEAQECRGSIHGRSGCDVE